MKTNLKTILVFLGGIIVLIFGTWLTINKGQTKWVELRDYGAVGDFLSGTIGPVINLVGIFLVFFSFQEQVKANDIQSKGLEDALGNNLKLHNFNVLNTLLDSMIVQFEKDFPSGLSHISFPDKIYENRFYHSWFGISKVIEYLTQLLYLGYSFLETDLVTNDKSLLFTRYQAFLKSNSEAFVKRMQFEFKNEQGMNQTSNDAYKHFLEFTVAYAKLTIAINKECYKLVTEHRTLAAKIVDAIDDSEAEKYFES